LNLHYKNGMLILSQSFKIKRSQLLLKEKLKKSLLPQSKKRLKSQILTFLF